MRSNSTLKYHYHPEKGWLNDPNGLCFFKGWYHIFYQHAPQSETPWNIPMNWGHARTRDFLHFEELPVALRADMPCDAGGVWSGTAIEKDGRLYLFYASVDAGGKQTVSVAYTDDGLTFVKYENNPVITEYPFECDGNFRDPAVFCEDGRYYLVIASADSANRKGLLLLYTSGDLFSWRYSGVLQEYEDCRFCECPSLVRYGNEYLLSVSVCPYNADHYFEVMLGNFDGTAFTPRIRSHFQKGPDEYAGQIFSAPDGRAILISWVSGWKYQPEEKCIGCLSIPLEITAEGDHLKAYPVTEVRHLVKDGGIIDSYVKETYTDGGKEVRIELLPEE
ncbi:MAG: hypothetical protein CW338_00705 [Clostridiales bacterium]|nr:hypothetical protein [Clostridiales bacterium]